MIRCSLYKTLQTSRGVIDLDVSFEIEEGTFVTLFGASGAGKTTILRMLAGLTTPEKGTIDFSGEIWFDPKKKINLPAQQRRLGFVFQDYALFPNMTVRENLDYALDKNEPRSIIEELMDVMDLQQLGKRKPETLSGGQKQRVALARALVRKPKLLLLDEPLSALDSEMRLKLQDHILKVHRQFNLTTILVSHDFAEIYKMSNAILLLENGKIIKHGATRDILLNEKMIDFQFTGQILEIEKHDMVYVLTVRVGNNVIRTIVSETERTQLQIGDEVLMSLHALNAVVKKIP